MTRTRRNRHRAQRARCGLVWLVATTAAAAMLAWLMPDLLGHGPETRATQRFEAVLVRACAAAAALGVGWLWVLVSLVTLDAVRGSQGRGGVPPFVRRGVLVACGLGLAGGIAIPAHGGPDRTPGPGAGASSMLAGLQLPDRTTTSHRRELPATPAADLPSRTLVVAPGDTLWDLAAADLPPGADARLVDAHWRAIHTANRAVIGPDPDLIHPGQWLRLPTPPRPGAGT